METYKTIEELRASPKFSLPACKTVGEMAAVLATLPEDLPLEPYEDGVKPVVFNKTRDIHLAIEINDGTWDD